MAVKLPHRHHKKGSPYHIRIDLTVPRGEIVVKREPSLDARARQLGEHVICITVRARKVDETLSDMRILLALDGSKFSHAAVHQAAALVSSQMRGENKTIVSEVRNV